jgi:hypothetical protein
VIVRYRQLFVISGAGLLLAYGLLAASIGPVFAACSFGQDHAVLLQQRIESADRLIADATQIEQRTGILIDQFQQLKDRNKRLASSVTDSSINVFTLYESLFKQYEDALNQYNQHRKEYFAHTRQFHQMHQPDSIVGANSQIQSANSSPYGDNSSGFANAAGVLKFKAQDKCTQLQALEGRILANESRLDDMVSDLETSMQKESQAMFANSWMAANQLAIQNSTLASQYNHLGMQKTAWYSQNVHNFIEEANRDGAYGAHVQAYRDLSNGNAMESEIYKRCQAHVQRASSTLNELASMRPQGLSISPPGAGQQAITADQLQRESNQLDSEYANVQDIFAKLESVRKSMPPSLKKNKGITN